MKRSNKVSAVITKRGKVKVRSYGNSGTKLPDGQVQLSWISCDAASEKPGALRTLPREEAEQILANVLGSIQYAAKHAKAEFTGLQISSACCVLFGLMGVITPEQMGRAYDVEEDGVIHTIIPNVGVPISTTEGAVSEHILTLYVEATDCRGWYASALTNEHGKVIAQGIGPVSVIVR